MFGKRLDKLFLLVFCCLGLSLVLLCGPQQSYGYEITIDVSPNVLNIQSDGQVVTVHTDVGYGDVHVSTVYLNGIAIKSWKADNRGYFVAKFLMDDVKLLPGLIIGDYNTLTFVGVSKAYGAFSGEQEIKVIDVLPQGSGK